MQLNITTDYAIRVLLYLSDKQKPVSSQEIASAMGIPGNYILKVCRKLREGELVQTERGKAGGYVLMHSIDNISLWDVIGTMEDKTKINRCLEEDCYCSRDAAETCPVRKVYVSLQSDLEKRLSSISLGEIQKRAQL